MKKKKESKWPKYGVVVGFDVYFSALGQPVKIMGKLKQSKGQKEKGLFYYRLEDSFCDCIRSDSVKLIDAEFYMFLLHRKQYDAHEFHRLYDLYLDREGVEANDSVSAFIKWLENRTDKFYDSVLTKGKN